MDLKFRDLRADEIDVRVAQVTEWYVTLLLFKDARVDMQILDETVGPMRWQRKHSRDNANCTVGIWDGGEGQWVEKEDTGTESNMEAEKGLASDSFKRACFNWGIGRELYTAPEIKLNVAECNLKELPPDKNGKKRWACYDKFTVEKIRIENKEITGLRIMNTTTGKVAFSWAKVVEKGNAKKEKEEPVYPPEMPNGFFMPGEK